MSRQAEIQKAIDSYAMWRARLRNSVATGIADPKAAQAEPDNLCEFGKWLYALPPAERGGPHFEKVLEQHAEFHRQAAGVLRLVEGGQCARAAAALEHGSSFECAGRQLTLTLIDWSKAA